MLPTPTELRTFTELYRTKHFTRAAIRLGVTQPTLTQSISKLEEKLGVSLFTRTRVGCLPTKAGDVFYRKASDLQNLWSDIGGHLKGLGDELAGTFRVGCHPSVGAYVLSGFLRKLSAAAPNIEVSVTLDLSRRITERILAYEVDLGFVVNPIRHADLVLSKFGDDEVRFWRKSPKSPKRLFIDANPTRMQTMMGPVARATFANWQVIEIANLELIRSLVNQNAGVGILPERVAKAEGSVLQAVFPALPTVRDEIFVAYRADVQKSAAFKVLVRSAKPEASARTLIT